MRCKRVKNPFAVFLLLSVVLLCAPNGVKTQDTKHDPKVEATGTSVTVKFQNADDQDAIPMTIPITARWRKAEDKDKGDEVLPLGDLTVKEDGDEQTILSIRSIGNSPIYLAILIQDDLVSSVANEIKGISEFIQKLPKGSRVMVGYIRSGSLQVKQKFTGEPDKAVKALRIPVGSSAFAPYNPYVEIIEGLKRFDTQPTGRRAMLVISDGVDVSRGIDSSTPGQSHDLDRAINEAQRRSVAIYSIYAPTVSLSERNSFLRLNGQGSLDKLSDETGGYAHISVTSGPVSFDPFLKRISGSLYRQLAITYLSTHTKKGYHRIEVISNQPDVKIDHPAGYTRK